MSCLEDSKLSENPTETRIESLKGLLLQEKHDFAGIRVIFHELLGCCKDLTLQSTSQQEVDSNFDQVKSMMDMALDLFQQTASSEKPIVIDSAS